MKAFSKKITKLVNLTSDSLDLNTLKEREKKINEKYKKNIANINKQLEELQKDQNEITKMYDFRDRYLGLSNQQMNVPTPTSTSNTATTAEEDSDSENEEDNSPPNSLRERINLVFAETTHKLSIIENDISSKVTELNNKKQEMEREYERAKEVIQQKLRDKRDKIKDNKKSFF